MTQQSRNTAPLRTSVGLGDEGMRRTAAALSRVSPFPVDPGWAREVLVRRPTAVEMGHVG